MHGHQVKPDAFISACVVSQVPMFYASRKASIKSAVPQWQSARLETEGPQVQASQASLRCVLAQEHNSYLSTGSTRKTCLYITEILLMGCKESNQTNKQINQDCTFLQAPKSHPCLRTSISAFRGYIGPPQKITI